SSFTRSSLNCLGVSVTAAPVCCWTKPIRKSRRSSDAGVARVVTPTSSKSSKKATCARIVGPCNPNTEKTRKSSRGSWPSILTHKLNDILKFNNQLRMKLDENTPQSQIDECWGVVQLHAATYIDNEISKLPKATHRSGRPLKTLRMRIKAKDGRIRGNLMGKR